MSTRPRHPLFDGLIAQGMSRATAFRIIKRGGTYNKSYHVKHSVPPADGTAFDAENAYRIARAVFFRYYGDQVHLIDDLIQEAVVRQYELAGQSQHRGFLWATARNAIRSYLQKEREKWNQGDCEKTGYSLFRQRTIGH